MPAPPPPATKSSASGSGEQTVEFTLGLGMYRLWAASISTTHGYQEAASINYIYKTGDGSEITIPLTSGHVRQYIPLCLSRPVILQGRGIIRAKCTLATTGTFDFNVEYAQMDETELIGVTR